MFKKLFTVALYALSATSLLFASQTYNPQGLAQQKEVFILPVAVDPATNRLSLLLVHTTQSPYWVAPVSSGQKFLEGSLSLLLSTNLNYFPRLRTVNPFKISQGALAGATVWVAPVEYKDVDSLKRTVQTVENRLSPELRQEYEDMKALIDDYAWFPVDTLQTKMTIPSLPLSSQGGRLALIDPQLHAALKSSIAQIRQGATQVLPQEQLSQEQLFGQEVVSPKQTVQGISKQGPDTQSQQQALLAMPRNLSPQQAVDWLFKQTKNPSREQFAQLLGDQLGVTYVSELQGLAQRDDERLRNLLITLIDLRSKKDQRYPTIPARERDFINARGLLESWIYSGEEFPQRGLPERLMQKLSKQELIQLIRAKAETPQFARFAETIKGLDAWPEDRLAGFWFWMNQFASEASTARGY